MSMFNTSISVQNHRLLWSFNFLLAITLDSLSQFVAPNRWQDISWTKYSGTMIHIRHCWFGRNQKPWSKRYFIHYGQILGNEKRWYTQTSHFCTSSHLVKWIQKINKYRFHDDVIEWKHFPRYWPFVRGIHRSSVNSPRKGQWRGALMFSLIYAWINCWVNNREPGDLRRPL